MKAAFEKIHKPEICDELQSTELTRYKPDPDEVKVVDNSREIALLEQKKTNELISISFVQNFANLNGREPTYIEYLDGINKKLPQEFINNELYINSIKEIKGSVLA